MELPAKVMINSDLPELKGMQGILIAISELGYYEVQMQVRDKKHTYLLPIEKTILMFVDSILEPSPDFIVER